MTAALERGEWSSARPGPNLPPGKTRYPFYRRLGGPQGRSRRAENLVPTGNIRQILEKNWGYKETMHHLFMDFKKAYDSLRMEVLYNILIEFSIPMQLVRLIKMCLNEIYSKVRVGKHLSDMFSIRNGLKKRRCSIAIAFQLWFRRVQVSQNGLKLNGTHQFLAYADVKILGGSFHTIQENVEALVEASKETGLEVNVDKTKYMVMSQRSECRTKSQYKDW